MIEDKHISKHLSKDAYGCSSAVMVRMRLPDHENSIVTMDISSKVKYNNPRELAKVVNDAFADPDS